LNERCAILLSKFAKTPVPRSFLRKAYSKNIIRKKKIVWQELNPVPDYEKDSRFMRTAVKSLHLALSNLDEIIFVDEC
jgi:hypothetical protein